MHVRTSRLATLLLLAVAACASPSPAPDLTVALEQSRDNENRHLLQVVLTGTGDEPVDVVRLQVRSPRFVDVAPTVRQDVLTRGRRIAFPIAYGPADCDGEGPATVVLGHRTADGLQEHVLRVPDDPTLPRLQRRECDLRELADSASIAFAPEWERRGDTAYGTLVLKRRSGRAPVTLTALEGSVLLTLRPTGPLPLLLAADADEARLPVEVTATRCDPHALTESKRTYDFPRYAALGDAEPLYATVRPGEPGRSLLEQVLVDTCRRVNGL